MRRRWRLLFGLALVLLVGASLLHPAIHWRLIGWAKGEAFYEGRPTTYWRRQIQSYSDGLQNLFPPSHPSQLGNFRAVRQRDWLDRWDDYLRGGRLEVPAILIESNAAAIPVLVELTRDNDLIVALSALGVLRRIDPEAAAKAGVVDP
jgi:hypothetical protein